MTVLCKIVLVFIPSNYEITTSSTFKSLTHSCVPSSRQTLHPSHPLSFSFTSSSSAPSFSLASSSSPAPTQSHSFPNQKPWHPLSYPSQRRKWIAKQTHTNRQCHIEEVSCEVLYYNFFFSLPSLTATHLLILLSLHLIIAVHSRGRVLETNQSHLQKREGKGLNHFLSPSLPLHVFPHFWNLKLGLCVGGAHASSQFHVRSSTRLPQ